MKHDSVLLRKRKPVNLSLDGEIVAAARDAGLNLSRVAEDALRLALKADRERRWQEEHRDAIAAFTEWFERGGDPLEGLRIR